MQSGELKARKSHNFRIHDGGNYINIRKEEQLFSILEVEARDGELQCNAKGRDEIRYLAGFGGKLYDVIRLEFLPLKLFSSSEYFTGVGKLCQHSQTLFSR
jgi:hypothetical protein